MQKVTARLRTIYDVLIGRFTVITLAGEQVVVMPNNLTKNEIRSVATAFFKRAYNL